MTVPALSISGPSVATHGHSSVAASSVLQVGARGPEVLQIQEALARHGLAVSESEPAGVFGTETMRQVGRFQKSLGRTANGVVDHGTQAALMGPVARADSTQQTARRRTARHLTSASAARSLSPLSTPFGARRAIPAPVAERPAVVSVVPNPAPVAVVEEAPAPVTSTWVDRAVTIAHEELGTVDYSLSGDARGWEHLGDIFESATGIRPSDRELQRTWQPRLGGGKDAAGISWCGLWTTYALQRAGLDVEWRWGSGIHGEVQLRYGSEQWMADHVRVGDVIVQDRSPWHHELVVGIEGEGSSATVTTISGNTYWGRIVKREHRGFGGIGGVYQPQPGGPRRE